MLGNSNYIFKQYNQQGKLNTDKLFIETLQVVLAYRSSAGIPRNTKTVLLKNESNCIFYFYIYFLRAHHQINKYSLHTRDITIIRLLIKSIFITDCIYGHHTDFVIIATIMILPHFISHWTILML